MQRLTSAALRPAYGTLLLRALLAVSFAGVLFMLATVAQAAVPLYYSASGRVPPLPVLLFPDLPLEKVDEVTYVYDDSSMDYSGGETFGVNGPSSPESSPSEGCALWLEISPPTNGAVLLTLHNTFPGKGYQLLSQTNVAGTNWTVETNLVATSNVTLAAVATNGRPNLFFRALEDYRMTTNNFAGMDQEDAGGSVPDTMGAVGQDHFVEFLNHKIAVYVKTNGMQVTNAFMVDFLSGSPTDFIFDPRIIYDIHSNRWVASANAFLTNNSEFAVLYIAVSKSANPSDLTTNNWWTTSIPVFPSGDYQTLGVDANGIYVCMHHPDPITGTNHSILAFAKSNLYQGDFAHSSLFVTNTVLNIRCVQAVVNFDPSPAGGVAWFVGKDRPELGPPYRGGAIRYRGLRWTGGTADWADTNGWRTLTEPTNTFRDYFDFEVGTPLNPPVLMPVATNHTNINISQFGGSLLINAVVRDGYLWTCQHVGLSNNGAYHGDSSGVGVSRSGAQWLKLRIGTNAESLSYEDHGRYYDPAPSNPLWYCFPSINVNAAGDMLMGFSAAGATNHLGAYYVWKPACGVADPQPRLIHDGEMDSVSGRLGDYSYTSVDPTDSLTFWTVQEYTRSREGDRVWGTRIAEIKPFP